MEVIVSKTYSIWSNHIEGGKTGTKLQTYGDRKKYLQGKNVSLCKDQNR